MVLGERSGLTPECTCGESRDRWDIGLLGRQSELLTAVADTGTPVVLVLLAWALSGPLFGFSEGWQLTINTFTTIVTFLMVFLIQHTQNRDSLAIHLKLDEILRSIREAHNELLDAEEMDDQDLDRLRRSYARLAIRAGKRMAGEDEREPSAAREP